MRMNGMSIPFIKEATLTLKYSSFSTLVLANQFLRFSATLASPQPPRFSALTLTPLDLSLLHRGH